MRMNWNVLIRVIREIRGRKSVLLTADFTDAPDENGTVELARQTSPRRVA